MPTSDTVSGSASNGQRYPLRPDLRSVAACLILGVWAFAHVYALLHPPLVVSNEINQAMMALMAFLFGTRVIEWLQRKK